MKINDKINNESIEINERNQSIGCYMGQGQGLLSIQLIYIHYGWLQTDIQRYSTILHFCFELAVLN